MQAAGEKQFDLALSKLSLLETGLADWDIGVQAIRGGEVGEVQLNLSSEARGADSVAFTCGRYSHFCPGQPMEVVENVSLLPYSEAESAAAVGGRGLRGVGGVDVGLLTAVVLVLTRRARRRPR